MSLKIVRPVRRSGHRRYPALLATLALSLGLSAGVAQAGTFGVQVVDDLGDAVAGASVCIGLPGNYSQFGALYTDREGHASADVPNVPLVVTVSKTRFAAIRINEPARSFNLIKKVVLGAGAEPGPRCRTDSSLAGPGINLDIHDIDVVRRGERTTLSPTVSGSPTHYRLSARDDLADGEWMRFRNDSEIAVPAAIAGANQVFLQLRRYDGDERGWLEARSPVSTVLLRGAVTL